MYISTTAMITALGMLRAASAAPLVSRQICGAAPTGTTAQTPISEPTGITTASACEAKAAATANCQSFLFGLVDGGIICRLFSVPASSLPPQTNLVAYDIGCTSIPSVVPTTANPGGLNTGASQSSSDNANSGSKKEGRQATQNGNNFGTHAAPKNAQPAGNPTPIATPKADSLAACLANCRGNAQCVNYTFESGVCKLYAATSNKVRRQQNGNNNFGTHAAPKNAQPAGNPTPIATPKADSLAACLANCRGNAQCVNYTFESGVCKLYAATSTKARRQQNGSPNGGNTGNQNQGGNTANPSTGGNGNGNAQQGTHANPVNATPAGSPSPIATPAVNDLAACLASCRGNSACVAYTFQSGVCRLFN
ncbi:hypothetical protein B0O99DRAFT_598026 [Bisporella sp. PMI_857]|nr:hypothetical protein B0O99DRAFT_598026 [Bisporella sp. PMI_857]